MRAKYILAVFACVFLLAGFSALASASRRGQARTWLIVGAIFAGVSLWLFSRA